MFTNGTYTWRRGDSTIAHWNDWWIVIRFNLRATCCYLLGLPRVISAWPLSKMTTAQKEPTETSVQEIYHNNHMAAFFNWTSLSFNCANLFWSRSIETWHCLCQLDNIPQYIIWSTWGLNKMATCLVSRLRTTLKFWSATMFGAAARNLDCQINLSLRWLPTACHKQLAYFHWPQWVTWLVTWWVTWSRSPDAGRHIGIFLLWTTLLRFFRSVQISLFSNFTKRGQLFFDNIFFGLTS